VKRHFYEETDKDYNKKLSTPVTYIYAYQARVFVALLHLFCSIKYATPKPEGKLLALTTNIRLVCALVIKLDR
jgi:hypothetical protein